MLQQIELLEKAETEGDADILDFIFLWQRKLWLLSELRIVETKLEQYKLETNPELDIKINEYFQKVFRMEIIEIDNQLTIFKDKPDL